MKVIGLCGGSGSGKGSVGGFFTDDGIPVIDTDAIYHDLISRESPCLFELVAEFGDGIVKDGALDRRALASIVFKSGNENKLDKLNKIAHLHILSEARRMLSEYEKRGYTHAVVDAPLLFESGFDSECDAIVSVISNKELRISRIMARDGIDRASAERRIASQASDEYLIGRSDYVIYNNGTLGELELVTRTVMSEIKNNFVR